MKAVEESGVVITGLGMITPAGQDPATVLTAIERGVSVFAPPSRFDGSAFACPLCAEVREADLESRVREPKLLRLMNRDALLAVAAAGEALRDAQVQSGRTHAPDTLGIFGAVGMAGMPLSDMGDWMRLAVNEAGAFDANRFGREALRAIPPLFSFKILGNMPVCFISIQENLQGPNGVYAPWEGQGARALEMAARSLRQGRAACVLAGGCDVKTHELAFLCLDQQGAFDGWKQRGQGPVPGEGAAFLVLETQQSARGRGARIYARWNGVGFAPLSADSRRAAVYSQAMARAVPPGRVPGWIVSGTEADPAPAEAETLALRSLGLAGSRQMKPKLAAGNLFAGAAALQVSLGALLAARGESVLVNCFGHGAEQGAFWLDPP